MTPLKNINLLWVNKWATNLITVCVTMVVAIAAVEIVLRYFDFDEIISSRFNTQDQSNCKPGDFKLGDSGFRNSMYVNTTDDFKQILDENMCLIRAGFPEGLKGFRRAFPDFPNLQHFHIYKNGMRGTAWDSVFNNVRSETENQLRVLLMGGSSAWSHLVSEKEALDARLAFHLSNALTKKPEAKFDSVVVLNAAMPGSNSRQDFNAFKHFAEIHAPQVAVFFAGWNDLAERHGETKIPLGFRMTLNRKIQSILSETSSLAHTFSLDGIGTLFYMTAIRANELLLFPEEVLLQYWQHSKELCSYENIECIFVLQPGLFVTNKVLGIGDKRLLAHHEKYLSDNHNYKTRKLNYPKVRKILLQNGFDFVDEDTYFSSDQRWTNATANDEFSVIIPKNSLLRILGSVSGVIEAKVDLGIEHDATKKEFFVTGCPDLSGTITENSSVILCRYDDSRNIEKILIADNDLEVGYSGLMVPKNGNFSMNNPFHGSEGSIELRAVFRNYRNNNEIKVNVNGNNNEKISTYSAPKHLLEIEAKLPSQDNIWPIEVELDGEPDSHIGLAELHMRLNVPWAPRAGIVDYKLDLKMKNNLADKDSLSIEFAPNYETFIDAAHLTNAALDLIALEISKKIEHLSIAVH